MKSAILSISGIASAGATLKSTRTVVRVVHVIAGANGVHVLMPLRPFSTSKAFPFGTPKKGSVRKSLLAK